MPRTTALPCLTLVLALTGTGRADEAPPPTSLIYTSSDFPDLARGLRVPRSGEYILKAWAGEGSSWVLKSEGAAITLTPTAPGGPAKPGWQTLGRVSLAPDAPAMLAVVPGATPAVPSVLSLSTDPDFVASKALDVLRGNIRTAGPTADRRRTVIRTTDEGADFRPPSTPEAWRARADSVREQLLVALGLRPMPPRTDLHPRVVGTLERDGYAIDRVVLETFPRFYLAGNLYRPTTAKGRSPVVMCPHGHWPEGRVNPDVQSRCVRLAQLGCVVFLYDMVGYADGKPFGHAFLDDRLRRWGLSLPSLQAWNSIRALDWLTSRPDVDPTRVAVTGESGGATQTLLLSAIDPRVKVAAPVVMVSDSYQGGSFCENAAGLRIGTDNVEIAALIAPRPLKVVGATGDWTARLMTNAYPSLQMVYALTGAATHLEADVFDFPHNYNRTSRNAVYAFLAKWLLGPADAESTREGTLKLEDPKDLYAFNAKTPYPADAKTPAQLESDLVVFADQQIEALAPGVKPAAWEAARDLFGGTLKVRVGLEKPAPRETTAKEIRRVSRDGLTIAHAVVGRQGKGDVLPVVRIIPAHANGRATVVFTSRGKADLIAAGGEPTPLVRALLNRGQTVVGLDPLLVGESHDPLEPAEREDEQRDDAEDRPADRVRKNAYHNVPADCSLASSRTSKGTPASSKRCV